MSLTAVGRECGQKTGSRSREFNLPQLQTAVPHMGAAHIPRNKAGQQEATVRAILPEFPGAGWAVRLLFLPNPAAPPSRHSTQPLMHILHPKLHLTVHLWGAQPTDKDFLCYLMKHSLVWTPFTVQPCEWVM